MSPRRVTLNTVLAAALAGTFLAGGASTASAAPVRQTENERHPEPHCVLAWRYTARVPHGALHAEISKGDGEEGGRCVSGRSPSE
jgi:hypothetical protein